MISVCSQTLCDFTGRQPTSDPTTPGRPASGPILNRENIMAVISMKQLLEAGVHLASDLSPEPEDEAFHPRRALRHSHC